MAPRTFYAPRRFHPGYSWLGRWLRRRTDRRQGEALHILVGTGLALALLLIHALSWTLLHAPFAASPSLEAIYWSGQLALLGAALALCGIGWRPALTVTCRAQALVVEQGQRTLTVPYATLAAIQPVSAVRFHRHERRHAATRVFIGALHDEVLLLRRHEGGPIALALPPAVHAALHDALAERLARRPHASAPAA